MVKKTKKVNGEAAADLEPNGFQAGHERILIEQRVPGSRRKGFSTLEILYAMILLSVVLAISVPPLRSMGFSERIQDTAFLDQLKGAIIEQRVRYIKEPGIGYNFVLDGSGTVRFYRQGVCYLYLNDPRYRVYIQKGGWYKILTLYDFKNRTTTGQDGFTISIYNGEQLVAKLIFQVATSTFREEYHG